MTDVVRPVLAPLTTVTDEVSTPRARARSPSRRSSTAGARAANPMRLAQILEDLAADAALTLNARSHAEFCNALRAWGDDARSS